jgi:hypothetical protein
LETNNYKITKEKGTDDNFSIVARKLERSQGLGYHANIEHIIGVRNETKRNSRTSEIKSSIKVNIEKTSDITPISINDLLGEKLKKYGIIEHRINELFGLD